MILIYKIVQWLLSKAARVGFAILIIFALFFTLNVLVPKFQESTAGLRDTQSKITDLRSEQSQLSIQLTNIDAKKTANQNLITNLENKIKSASDSWNTGLGEVMKKVEQAKGVMDGLEKWNNRWLWVNSFIWRESREAYDKLEEAKKQLADEKTQLENYKKSGPSVSKEDGRLLGGYKEKSKELRKQEDGLISEIDSIEEQITDLDGSLNAWQRFYRSISKSWNEFTGWLFWIAAGLLLAPIIWSLFMYYVIAAVATKQRPIQLLNKAPGGIYWADPKASLNVKLPPAESLWVRNELLTQHDGAPKRTVTFWNWRAPAVSTLAGLAFCTKVTNTDQRHASFVFSSNKAEEEISEIVLEDDSAMVLHVSNIVAISGDVTVSAQWRIFNLNAWLTGQLRFLLFKGPGSIYVCSPRGVEGFKVTDKQLVEQQVTVGFDAGLNYSVNRTETFVPYFRGQASLFDDCIQGQGVMFRKNAACDGRKNIMERTFGTFFAIIGKMLGF